MNCTFRHSLLFLLSLFLSNGIYGQTLEVTDGNNAGFDPETIVSNFFLGEGVDVVDINFEGTSSSVGFFKGGDMIGIDRGIVLTSGAAATQNGANLGADASSDDLADVNNNSGVNDVDLNNIAAGSSVNNVTKYTITFIPIADTLRFRYVFASEEYPEYACSEYNDVFGFFISGPGINGPYENNGENIALIPETNLPVTINNVNPGEVGANGLPGFCTPPNGTLNYDHLYNTTPFGQQPVYDGFTDVFTAEVVVQPCQTYTIKLAIADVSDTQLDSGVFLEAKSFGTGSLEVETTTVSLDGTVTEGCSEGVLSFALPYKVESDFPLDYQILGTATNGVDYSTIPTDLFIAQGDSVVSIPIVAFEDNMEEGVESIIIDVQRDICNRDTFYFFIRDNELVPPNLRADTVICAGSTVEVDGTLPIDIPPPPRFEWEGNLQIHPPNELIYADLEVFGVFPVDLGPNVIESICIDSLFHPWIDDMDLFIVNPAGQFMELSTDNGGNGGNGLAPDYFINTCFTEDAINPINAPGIVAPPDSVPFTGNYLPEGEWIDIYSGPTNGTWQLMMVDDQPDNVLFAGNLFNWSITFRSAYTIDYQWTPIAGVECPTCPNTILAPTETTTYTLTATDSYGCQVSDEITIEVIDRLPAPIIMCDGASENSVSVVFEEVTGANGYEVNVDGNGWNPVTDNLTFTADNLTAGQQVTIEIRAVGDCEGDIGSVICETTSCIPPSGEVNSISHVSCNGGENGIISLSASGGSGGPYNYTLDSQTNDTGMFDGLGAGTYQIAVSDAQNCPDTVEVLIEEPAALVSSEMILDEIACNDETNGSGTVGVMGGTAPYSFFWSSSENDSIAIALTAGDNFVTVIDAHGCSIIDTITLNNPDAITLDTVITHASCNGASDGQAIVVASGGTGDYVYQWDNNAGNQTTDTAYTLLAGIYEVTVSDINDCQSVLSVTIDEPEAMELMTASTDASCSGVLDASATVTASGGAGDYTYLWNDPDAQTTATAIDLTVGDYFVIVTDANSCFDTAFVSVSSPNEITVEVITEPTSCVDTEDGAVTLNVSGGTPGPGYTFDWSDGSLATDSRTDLAPGMVEVTITDANGCFEVEQIVTETPDTLILELAATGLTCNGGDDGTATVTPMGGTGPYSFLWDDANAQTTATASDLPTGTVTVIVTDDNGCTATNNIEIMEAPSISIDFEFTSPSCFEGDNGMATATAMGGVGGFTYLWNDIDEQDTQTAVDLAAGTYEVTATDDAGCFGVAMVTIPDASELITTTSVGTASCNGSPDGTASVNVIGGVEPYEYMWSNGQDTETATGLSEMMHFVTVTDANGCQAFDTVDVAAPPQLLVELTATNETCFGANDGTITAVASGGSGGYSYTWSEPSISDTPTPIDLIPNTYSVTVTDANNCETEASITINPAVQMELSNTSTDVECAGDDNGSIDLEVTGGVGAYTYEWDNGETTQDISGLAGGSYTVIVRDTNNCEATTTVMIASPDSIILNATPTHIDCFEGTDGAIAIEVSGGSGGFTYDWEGPNNFTAETEDINDLQAGDYMLVVTDGNDCSATLTVNLTQPATGLSGAIAPADVICFGANNGVATVEANGGTEPYIYAWSNGDNTATASGLAADTYEVTVTDAEGCSFVDMITIESREALAAELTQQGATCNNGLDGTASVMAVSYGNTSADLNDFTYNWNSIPPQSTAIANNLIGGQTYSVTITDDLGCEVVQSISIDNPDAIQLQAQNTQNVTCKDGADGTVTVAASGGTTPYTYLWDAAANSQATATASNLVAGNYTVTATDANECSATITVTVEEPRILTIDFAVTDVDCFGEANGRVAADVGGGKPPYQYVWSTGQTTPNLDNQKAGTYTLTIIDDNGCQMESTTTIEEPVELSAVLETEDITCFGGHDGLIRVEAMGGTPSYTYSLDNNYYTGSQSLIGLTEGDYRVYIKDSKGCIALSDEVTIFQPDRLTVDLGEDLIIDYGEAVELQPEVSGIFGSAFYEWYPQDTTLISCWDCPNPMASPPYQVSYKVVVTDENGCTDEDVLNIYINKERKVFVPTGFTPNGDDTNDMLLVHGPSETKVLMFRVFDRWGEMMYETGEFQVNDPTVGWNGMFRGKMASGGAYIWYLEVEYVDGETEVLKGSTNLIR